MENNETSSRERVQRLFNKNVELENKRRKAAQARIPSDPNAWQQMRENYETIVLEDHSFSEQHDIEYALWQLHYRRIEELRALLNAALASTGPAASQNGKGPGRSGLDRVAKIRTQFKTFLSEATGFYHDLMLKIRGKYGLPLGYFSDDPNNQIPMSKDGNKNSGGNMGLISCHRCLIYLGDLARYKALYGEGDSKARDFAAASSYYMQASSLCPSNGNPHHQLAILAGYSNDELVSIYRYFRSLAVDNPFVTARDNLIIAFEKNRQNYIQLLGDNKTPTVKTAPPKVSGKGRGKGESRPSAKEIRLETNVAKEKTSNSVDPFKAFVTRFVRLNGILFTRTSLETFAEIFSTVKSDLLEILSSGVEENFNFGSEAADCRLVIVRVVAILIFTVHNVKRENDNQSYADILQRSVLLQNALTATFEFMGCIVERCCQLNDPSSSYLLPGIMVFVEWLACHLDVAIGSELEEKQVNARSFFWKNCIALLNKLQTKGYVNVSEHEDETCFSNMSKYDETETTNRLALFEDFELRGFVPLHPAQLILDFSAKHSFGVHGGNQEKVARIQRIAAAGKALTNVVRVGEDGFYFDILAKKFVFGSEPQLSDDYPSVISSEPVSKGCLPDISFDSQVGPEAMPEMDIGVEDEDEDEVIVFMPSKNEKHEEELYTKTDTAEIHASVSGNGRLNDEKASEPFSIGRDNYLLQSTLNMSIRQPTFTAGFTSQHMLPVQPSSSTYLGGQSSMINGFSSLNLMENGPSLKSEVHDQVQVLHPASFSMPYPNFVNANAGLNFPARNPQASVPSKYDTNMYVGAISDSLADKPSAIMPPGQKKSPVSRPVRHIGPPPGFSSVPSKAIDETSNLFVKKGNSLVPQMDDYRWLDGYQSSSTNQNIWVSSSSNQVGPIAQTVNKNNGSLAVASFPFPGKQAPASNLLSENHRNFQDHEFPEHVKAYQEQLKSQNGNLLPVTPPQQYQGQSLWEGRFFV